MGADRFGGVGMKEYFAISEMASIFGISRQTLIYYDKIGLFKPAKVNEKGYRLYAPTQIPYLRLICLLAELGLSLDEIRELMVNADVKTISEHLSGRVEALDTEIASLVAERSDVQDRLTFYSESHYWLERVGEPELRFYPKRYLLFEPFPECEVMGRPELHTTLMRAILRMKGDLARGPMRGWGTMLQQGALRSDDPLEGAGSFVLLTDAAAESDEEGVEELPEGAYLCVSRWGMPYEPEGIRQAMAYVDEHALKVRGNAYDLCFLDTTSYDEEHQVDFCCIQIPVEL